MPQPTEDGFEVVMQALDDLQQVAFIFEEFENSDPPSDFACRVKVMLKDAVLPQDDKAQSKGRDTQCELFVAATCARAGLRPVFAEPDLRCTLARWELGVAVKRVKSVSKLKHRLQEAAKQVKRSTLPGVVVADISMALNPQNSCDMQMESVQSLGQHVEEDAERLLTTDMHLRDALVRSGVLGVVLIVHQVRLDRQRGWELGSVTVPLLLHPYNQLRTRQCKEFYQRFEAGFLVSADGG
ncbi:MAG: hypothetical protein NTU53_06395 [Planctomycetota bacterium]|nr:hypothetical protein [Planctomycetota bacterium]